MAPFLLDGDRLVVRPVEWDALHPGDIVTCRLDDHFPTFRVVRKLATKLVLRGDAWPAKDFEAWPEDLLGKVVERRRAGSVLTEGHWQWRAHTAYALADDRSRRLKCKTEALATRVTGAVHRRAVRWLLGRDAPPVVHVNISANCNLECRMCPYLPVHDDSTYVREMSEDTFRALLPSLRYVRRLQLTGSGEPFMNRNLVKFVDLARTANPNIEVAITTNGTMLTETIVRALIERRLTQLSVSIDGVLPETVSAIRVGINAKKVYANVAMVNRLKREMMSTQPLLQLNFVVGYGNYAELPEFVRAAARYGVKQILVLEVIDGTAESVRNDLRHSLERDNGAGLRLAKRLADHAGITLLLPVTSHTACFHPSTPHVAENGDVSPCCYVDYEGRSFFVDGKTVRMPKITYGNITDVGLDGAWRSRGYRDLRERNARGDLPPSCQTCLSARAPTSIRIHQLLG